MIHLMMLEPLHERYTAQWTRWIPSAMRGLRLKYNPVAGKCLTSKIETGSVLDAHGTSYWKSTQMANLIGRIYRGEVKNGDTVWFADLWYPGIEHLAYIRSLTGIKFKISGVLHAGSWDEMDFINRTGIDSWCKGFEQTMFKIADEIHVATEYHREMIIKKGWCSPKKIKVTGLFFDAKEVRGIRDITEKDPNLVVFCQRLDPEKKPELFDKLAFQMSLNSNPTGLLKFVKTRDLKLDKDGYYDLLAKASFAVSFDGQETFGYTVLECMALGVTPVVADAKAYKETVPALCRWKNWEDLQDIIASFMQVPPDTLWQFANRYSPISVARKMFL